MRIYLNNFENIKELEFIIEVSNEYELKYIFSIEDKIKGIECSFYFYKFEGEIYKIIDKIALFGKTINLSFDILKSFTKNEWDKILSIFLSSSFLIQNLFPLTGIVYQISTNNSLDIDFWTLADENFDDSLYINKNGKISLSKRLAKNNIFISENLKDFSEKFSIFHKKTLSYIKNPPNGCKKCSIYRICKGYLKFTDKNYICSDFIYGLEKIKSILLKKVNISKSKNEENKKAIFSLPFYTYMDEEFLDKEFLPFLDKYGEYIYDIYFTYNTPPFLNDAMSCGNPLKGNSEDEDIVKRNEKILDIMLFIQQKYSIKVSATFNDIQVTPTKENFELFLHNIKPLYNLGIKSITIPHYSWMLDYKLKREFPDMIVKNTVLRKVSRAQEYVDYAKVGFDVINIDRYNLRDRDNLKRLKKAYDKYKVPMAILANEGCRGLCPAMSEHFHYNCSNFSEIGYFKSYFGSLTCPVWKNQNGWYSLQVANIPVFREDLNELLEYVQILKLHGRDSIVLLKESMDIIRRYADNEKIVFKNLYDLMKERDYKEENIKFWREYTKNCKFECWDCNVCEELDKSGKHVMNF